MRICKILLFLITIQSLVVGQGMTDSPITIGHTIQIESSILNETREIYIYLPQGLWGMDENMTNLPVIYVLDGESQFKHTATTVDFLSMATNGNDFIPRSIVVGIPNTNRDRDLTPKKDVKFESSGGGPEFLDFISEELIPHIDSIYSTSEHRTIIGHSLGGLAVLEALLRKRENFDNYIAIDPALGYANETYLHEVLDTLASSDLLQENVYFSAANNRPMFLAMEDMMSDSSEFMTSIDIPNQKFIQSSYMDKWNINLTVQYYPDENHYSVPHIATRDGLKELYHFYTFPEITNYYHPRFKEDNDLVEKVKEHYKYISDKLRFKVMPMQGYINSFAHGLSHFDREDIAIDLFEYNIENHPDDPIVYNNLGYYYKSKGYTNKAIEVYRKSLEIKEDKSIVLILRELLKNE